jgi:hypothetical protein
MDPRLEEMERSKVRPGRLRKNPSQYKVPEGQIATMEVFHSISMWYHFVYPCQQWKDLVKVDVTHGEVERKTSYSGSHGYPTPMTGVEDLAIGWKVRRSDRQVNREPTEVNRAQDLEEVLQHYDLCVILHKEKTIKAELQD